MNKKREPYDRIAVGERIRHKRIQLGLSQDELAVRINRATKYCSDIERGMCGMSVETMLAIAKSLDMNLDYMMFGEISETEREWQQKEIWDAVMELPLYRQMNAGVFLNWKKRHKAFQLAKEATTIILGSDCHNMDTRHPNLAEGRIVLVKKYGEAFLQKTDRLTREVLQ